MIHGVPAQHLEGRGGDLRHQFGRRTRRGRSVRTAQARGGERVVRLGVGERRQQSLQRSGEGRIGGRRGRRQPGVAQLGGVVRAGQQHCVAHPCRCLAVGILQQPGERILADQADVSGFLREGLVRHRVGGRERGCQRHSRSIHAVVLPDRLPDRPDPDQAVSRAGWIADDQVDPESLVTRSASPRQLPPAWATSSAVASSVTM